LHKIEGVVGLAKDTGLFASDSRFTFDPRVADYLVPAGWINAQGTLERSDNAWMKNAWDELETLRLQPRLALKKDTLLPSTLIDSSSLSGSKKPSASDEYAPGDVIGQTYVVRDVRKGGMGIVYFVEHLESRKEKITLRLALKTFQSRYLWSEEAIGRFEREAIVWVGLGKHPNIVHAMLVHKVESQPYLWLEFVDGESLAELLNRKKLATSEAVNFGLQFCRGMRYAREAHNLIHRDVKPANILINRDNVLKITDFGLSKLQAELLEETCARENVELRADEMETVSGVFLTAAGKCMGTPAYMAPEAVIAPQTVDTRTDIYSFGNVLYEMLTQQRPFGGCDILDKHLFAEPTPVRQLRADIPEAFDQIVSRCLEKEPDKRFQTFAELESALSQLALQMPATAVVSKQPNGVSVPLYGQWFMKGYTFMELGKFEDAIDCFREVIALDDNQHEAYNNVGVCLIRMGRFEEACHFVEKAAELKSDYPEAWSNLGGIYERLGRYSEGESASRRAIALRPNSAEALTNLGLNLAGMGHKNEAIRCYQRAIDDDSSYWLGYFRLANTFAERGLFEESVELLERAIQINPREPDLLASLAGGLVNLGRIDEAKKYVGLALLVDPQHPLAVQVEKSLS
jgi:serine/threonine protein kinase/Flp pilus assembly protein TadD